MQLRILQTLASLEPRWTLSGGGALSLVHTKHRTTRDLDLFWQAQRTLGEVPEHARRELERAGIGVVVLQRVDAFCRFAVEADGERTVVDLVADPVPLAEAPIETEVGGVAILVDTPHQILVNKLCALLSRSELRDLEDVQALVERGSDLERALRDAPAQDGGFSSLTFAWVLRGLPVEALGKALGRPADAIDALVAFRDSLVERVLEAAVP